MEEIEYPTRWWPLIEDDGGIKIAARTARREISGGGQPIFAKATRKRDLEMPICKANLTRSGDGEKETGDGVRECGIERERERRNRRKKGEERESDEMSDRMGERKKESGNKLWFGNKGILVLYLMTKISPKINGIKVFHE
ncbi:hypothetical protein L484_020424 [Morus notabilis]|uniref:Uncharacterized protein n=1 Tax=Morus notabilis TaxID=981085 RepID=W9SBG1_9ROSA|nr:hypothetical protein L484_020424 [Morus notabilis]